MRIRVHRVFIYTSDFVTSKPHCIWLDKLDTLLIRYPKSSSTSKLRSSLHPSSRNFLLCHKLVVDILISGTYKDQLLQSFSTEMSQCRAHHQQKFQRGPVCEICRTHCAPALQKISTPTRLGSCQHEAKPGRPGPHTSYSYIQKTKCIHEWLNQHQT